MPGEQEFAAPEFAAINVKSDIKLRIKSAVLLGAVLHCEAR